MAASNSNTPYENGFNHDSPIERNSQELEDSMAASQKSGKKQHAREKLAEYVYEYLLMVGANKTAQTFLSEYIKPTWDKSSFPVSESKSFLLSWWSLFYELWNLSTDKDSPEGQDMNTVLQKMQMSVSSLPLDSRQNITSQVMLGQHGIMSPITAHYTTGGNYSMSPTSSFTATMTTPTTWPATYPMADAVHPAHQSPILDSDIAQQEKAMDNVAILKLKESFEAEAKKFEETGLPLQSKQRY